jgi:hypothetical protein
MMRYVLAILLCVNILGCETKGLYDWEGYGRGESHSLKMVKLEIDARSAVETLNIIRRHVNRLEETGAVVPPGVYAELGTLYLDENNLDEALHFYRKEGTAWPESLPLMEKLISGLARRQQGAP